MDKDQIARVRTICLALPGSSEKISHGEPTFFVKKRVFVMFANNHHGDGHVAVWLPVESGFQTILIENDPATYFRPPYVGTKGWVGIELTKIDDAGLSFHIGNAWSLISEKRKS
jgi:hypothetical protein